MQLCSMPNSGHILVVEDEPKVAVFIKKGLEENNYTASLSYNGQSGLELATTKKFDAIILDLNLPLMHGYDVCKKIRENNPIVPILILTALSTTEDKITGFEFGADDYLVKPFEFRELMVRIKALINRAQRNLKAEKILRMLDLELHTETKKVIRNHVNIELTAKEFALLQLLMQNPGKVITRTEIAEKIWEINFDTGTNVIDVYINFLRKKIDKNHPVKLIHTYIGMGYVMKES